MVVVTVNGLGRHRAVDVGPCSRARMIVGKPPKGGRSGSSPCDGLGAVPVRRRTRHRTGGRRGYGSAGVWGSGGIPGMESTTRGPRLRWCGVRPGDSTTPSCSMRLRPARRPLERRCLTPEILATASSIATAPSRVRRYLERPAQPRIAASCSPSCRSGPQRLSGVTGSCRHRRKASKSHLLVGNSDAGKWRDGMDHRPWTSMLRLTRITEVPPVTTMCR